MRIKIIYAFLVLVTILGNVVSVLESVSWWKQTSQLVFILLLFSLFFGKISLGRSNFTGFLVTCILASITSFFGDAWFFTEVTLGLWLISFVFLVMEAIKFTQYNRRNRYLHLYFFVVVAIYTYLFSMHILEIRDSLSNQVLFPMYLIYYVNLLILGVTALIYYLNSFSKKAVFFSCLALAFILSDVLRDMGIFYFRDLSVEIAGSLIRMAGIALAFLFFITREKKLRLLNLI